MVMVRRWILVAIGLAALLAVWGTALDAQAQTRQGNANDLFYNYYAPPGSPAGVTAAMYPSPRPTPPLVGHTYITYQPLMPHEFLYQHKRVYWTQHCDAKWTRTKVEYGSWPFNCLWRPSVMWSVPAVPAHPTFPCSPQ